MKTVRIATETATGKRYIVQSLDFRSNLAYCWGEVTKTSGLSSTHGPSKRLPLASVTISEVAKDSALLAALFEQSLNGLRAEGHVLVESGRKNRYVTDLGKQK